MSSMAQRLLNARPGQFGFSTVQPTPETGRQTLRGLLALTPAGDVEAIASGLLARDPVQAGLGALSLAIPGTIKPEMLKPLTRSQFFRKYAQHIDIRGDSREGIMKEGFRAGIGPNALPPYQGGNPLNIMEKAYAPRKGNTVYLAPRDYVKDTPSGLQIQSGWKPEPWEIIDVDQDFPDMYEQYLKAFKKAHDG